MLEKDYYHTLGVSRNASQDEIKKAFRRLALKYHPDRCPGNPESEDRFKEINEAYAVLSDRDKRSEYDHFGPQRFRRRYREDDLFRAFDFEGLFREFGLRFDDDFLDRFSCGRRWKRCGGDRRKFWRRGFHRGFPFEAVEWERNVHDLPVSQKEATYGTEREIVVETDGRQRRYLVRIPPGVMNGTILRIPLEEEPVYFEVRLAP
ncbi:MAG: DnaJ domain-containing protein [Promethearchaeota archaeon]